MTFSQLVLPSGQVEITTSGHIEDYEDATLIPREDIEKINEVILVNIPNLFLIEYIISLH